MSSIFTLNSPYQPQGDQPSAIKAITECFERGDKHHVLLGVTGSGKTFTMANVIKKLNRPALIMAPNKTLAAQLFSELKEFFPENSVGFFISYYDYYQPEAYVPNTDTYIAKDSAINEDIDKMRHAATQALFERKDVVIVASVSCIYGLGSPASYAKQVVQAEVGMTVPRNRFLRQLVNIQYTRNDTQLQRGSFRVRGDTVDILPSHQKDEAIRVEFFGDEIERLSIIDALTGKTLRQVSKMTIYPNSHYIADRDDMKSIINEILHDLGVRLRELKAENKLVEYQRLEQRTMHDVEMLEEIGFCPGIENYSRYLSGAAPGQPPPTLLDYFPKDYLTIIDESHITVPQIGGMYRGDRARKQTLVDFGFRLPSAMDNRPLQFEEFMARTARVLYVSATPSPYEIQISQGQISEQIIRPTGLVDPVIEIRPAKNQVDDLLEQIRVTVKNQGRVLITTLTKRMAEDMTTYFKDIGVKVRYLHSDIEAIERVELLRDLRKGVFDVLIGINLLREGLDLPEVKLVAVMDADKEGFLRSRAALIQTTGRAARNVEGRVIFYADKVTDSIKAALDETDRRRTKQVAYNVEHNITPQTIAKRMLPGLREIYGISSEAEAPAGKKIAGSTLLDKYKIKSEAALDALIRKKGNEMKKAAADLEFEKAAEIRDEINALKEQMMIFSGESDMGPG